MHNLQADSIFKFRNLERGALLVGRTTSAEVVVLGFYKKDKGRDSVTASD